VSRSVLFLVKASRMRACARDTASRLCVRTVFCRSTFSLVPPLRSTDSFAASAAPFASFPATMGRSDFSRPFIVGYGLRPSRRGPCNDPHGQPGDLPVPEQKDSAHARFYDDAGSASVSRYRRTPCRLLKDGGHRHPEVGFRRSMAGLRTPLSTLRIDPRGPLRMTRGRCGSLNLHRKGLAPSTSCRSPGAPIHPNRSGRRASGPSQRRPRAVRALP
jgi:hypothetical protein